MNVQFQIIETSKLLFIENSVVYYFDTYKYRYFKGFIQNKIYHDRFTCSLMRVTYKPHVLNPDFTELKSIYEIRIPYA